MHPFPPVAELPSFVGDMIMQIWLDPYGVRFCFESRTQIYCEHRIEHIEAGGTTWAYDCTAANGPPLLLHTLLCKRVTRVEREDLRLTFRTEDEASLSIFSELGPYESGQICTTESFIVF